MNSFCPLFIVDDDQEERYMMQIALADIDWGDAAMFFHSAEACLRHLALLHPHQYPALILADYHMPGINGGMLLDLLKESQSFRQLPFFIYSTHLTPALKQSLLQRGAAQCFEKARNYAAATAFAVSLRAACLTGIHQY